MPTVVFNYGSSDVSFLYFPFVLTDSSPSQVELLKGSTNGITKVAGLTEQIVQVRHLP